MMSKSNAVAVRDSRLAGSARLASRSRVARRESRFARASSCALALSLSPAAGRTCTTSRSTAGCGRARSSPTARARGRWSKARSRAARCRKTRRSSPARSTRSTSRNCRSPSTSRCSNRGQERFNIYCSPCHDRTGSGNGMVVQRGFRQPPSFHIDRLRQADVGHFFDVMTNGFGAMPDYRAQIAPRDRWAIVAYIRALQLSQHAAAADVPGGDPTKVPQPAARRRARAGEALIAWIHTQ